MKGRKKHVITGLSFLGKLRACYTINDCRVQVSCDFFPPLLVYYMHQLFNIFRSFFFNVGVIYHDIELLQSSFPEVGEELLLLSQFLLQYSRRFEKVTVTLKLLYTPFTTTHRIIKKL